MKKIRFFLAVDDLHLGRFLRFHFVFKKKKKKKMTRMCSGHILLQKNLPDGNQEMDVNLIFIYLYRILFTKYVYFCIWWNLYFVKTNSKSIKKNPQEIREKKRKKEKNAVADILNAFWDNIFISVHQFQIFKDIVYPFQGWHFGQDSHPSLSIILGDQLNMVAFFWYLVKSDLSSVRYLCSMDK